MKKILCLILAMAFALVGTGCGPEIADTNGPDDYSLAEITEENIIKQDIGASAYSRSPGEEENDDLTEVTKFKGKEFSGVASIFLTNYIWASSVEINVSTFSVESGNFALVVLLDGEIVHEFNPEEELEETFTMDDVKGTLEIVMAGESADFKFWISRS